MCVCGSSSDLKNDDDKDIYNGSDVSPPCKCVFLFFLFLLFRDWPSNAAGVESKDDLSDRASTWDFAEQVITARLPNGEFVTHLMH